MRKRKSASRNPKKLEGNKYDKIIKENLESILPVILRRTLGLKKYRLENIPQIRLQSTIEREPDFLKKIFTDRFPKGAIIQIEFQTEDEKDMDARMFEYCGFIYRVHRLPVLQYLIFLPEKKPTLMTGKLQFPDFDYQFNIHQLSEISYKLYLESDEPEEVVLAILGDPENTDRSKIVELIMKKLVALRGNSLASSRFVNQLRILGNLRNLPSELFKNTLNMIFTKEQIESDYLFIEGKESGLKKGLEKGLEQGEDKKAITTIINMTREELPPESISKFIDESLKFVKQIQKELKKEEQIKKLFDEDKLTDAEIAKKLKVSELLVTVLWEQYEKE